MVCLKMPSTGPNTRKLREQPVLEALGVLERV